MRKGLIDIASLLAAIVLLAIVGYGLYLYFFHPQTFHALANKVLNSTAS